MHAARERTRAILRISVIVIAAAVLLGVAGPADRSFASDTKATSADAVPALITRLPHISGAPAIGSMLSAVPGSWGPAPVTLSFQWIAGQTAVVGATGAKYEVRAVDVGKTITVRVTGSKAGYRTVSMTSPATAIVPSLPVIPGTPTISGTVAVGSTLTVVPGSWRPAPVTLAYQWLVGGSLVAGATHSTFVVRSADVGKKVSVNVIGTKPGYRWVIRTALTAVVLNALTPTPVPTIQGAPVVGSTLTAQPGVWGPGAVALTYKWTVGSSVVAGQTSPTFVVRAADLGKSVVVQVTGSRSGFATVTRSSASLGPVLAAVGVRHVSGPISASTTWSPDLASVYILDGIVSVPSGVTLTVGPGTIIKGRSIVVEDGGFLDVAGSEARPATFTSLADDSAGGDTNGNGASSMPRADWSDYDAITLAPRATVQVAHAVFDYSDGAIQVEYVPQPGQGPVLTITDSTMRVPLLVTGNPTLVLERNTFAMRAYPGQGSQPAAKPMPLQLYDTSLATVVFTGADRNTFEGDDKARVVELVRATVPSATSVTLSSAGGAVFAIGRWSSDLVVRGSLVLDAGTIVKGGAIGVYDGASLDVAGTNAQPVTFTSLTDDSVGGDSEGDGAASGADLWDQRTAVLDIGEQANLSIVHATVDYAKALFTDYTQTAVTMVITDSLFRVPFEIGNWSGAGGLVFERNTFNMRENPSSAKVPHPLALRWIDVSQVAFTGADRNIFLGDGPARVVDLDSVAVPVGTTAILSGESGAVFSGSGASVSGTLTMLPGTVYKSRVDYLDILFTVASGGVLDVAGSAADPVVFTSLADDSIGGDSNADGAGPMEVAQWAGFLTFRVNAQATATITHARFDYLTGVGLYRQYDPEGDPSDGPVVTATDSTFRVPLSLWDHLSTSVAYVIERNTLDMRPYPAHAGMMPPMWWPLTVRADLSGIAFAGPDRNTFVGTGPSRLVDLFDAVVPVGTSATLSSEGGAIFSPRGRDSSEAVQVFGSLRFDPGTIVKNGTSELGTGFAVRPGGSVDVAGTSANPVIFTSLGDDSIGGDALVNGPDTGASQWATGISTFELSPTATATITHASFDYLAGGVFNFNYTAWTAPEDAPTVTMTDSVVRIHTEIQGIWGAGSFVLERNTFDTREIPAGAWPLPDHAFVPMPLAISRASLSGIPFVGADRNVFVGSGAGQIVEFYDAAVAETEAITLSSTGGAVFGGGNVDVAGSLTLEAGTILKGSRITMAHGGEIAAVGTPESPIVFTSLSDDSVGGDSEGDGQQAIGQSSSYLRFEDRTHATIANAVFMNSTAAVSVGEWSFISFVDSVFTNNEVAFAVDGASGGDDPSLDYLWGLLPCTPPYNSQVTMAGTWFGATGFPGATVDLAELAGEGLGHVIDDDTLMDAYGLMTSQFDTTVNVASNAIPWSLYSCTVGEVGITFPFTPVHGVTSPYLPGLPPSEQFSQR